MATVKKARLKGKIQALLTQNFPNARLMLDESKPLNKVSGMLIWGGFDGMEQIDRQSKLWRVLRSNLSPDEQLKITAILTMTPAER
jgi:hypothetical protein